MPMHPAPVALLALALLGSSTCALSQTSSTSAPDSAPTSAATSVSTSASTSATEAPAPNADFWRLVVSPYTLHYGSDPEHEPVYAIGLERQRSDKWFYGATYFSNSFGQPSGYLYGGQRYGNLFSVEPLFAQWSVGVLYGYKYPYEDKVPFNHNGWSPGAVLSLGWQFTREFSSQLNFLGSAALQLQLSIDFR